MTPPPPRSGGGRGPPSPEVVVEEDPPPPRSGSGRGSPPPPPQGKDQTRPAEKYCWASGRYALEKRLSCYLLDYILPPHFDFGK